jgi:hypothetical protein
MFPSHLPGQASVAPGVDGPVHHRAALKALLLVPVSEQVEQRDDAVTAGWYVLDPLLQPFMD